jgi:hypothetical protein
MWTHTLIMRQLRVGGKTGLSPANLPPSTALVSIYLHGRR